MKRDASRVRAFPAAPLSPGTQNSCAILAQACDRGQQGSRRALP